MTRVEFVDLHVAADLDIPAEPFLENPVSKPVHFGELVDKRTIGVRADELDHIRLLTGLTCGIEGDGPECSHPVQLHGVRRGNLID